MNGPPVPDLSGWVLALVRAGDAIAAFADRLHCGHHWHISLPPGGGDVYRATSYTCCACPGRRKRRPASPGRLECTRYTP